MTKKSFIYFGLSIFALGFLIVVFVSIGFIIGPAFWEYSVTLMPLLFILPIILAAIGRGYGKKARLESKELSSKFAFYANSLLLIFLSLNLLLLLLFIVAVYSFAE